MQGSLHGGGGEGQQPDLHAPAVMPWLLDGLQELGLQGLTPAAAGSLHAARMAAGGAGALLLLCPEGRSWPFTPNSSAGSAAEVGIPFAAARPWPDEEQLPGELGGGEGGCELGGHLGGQAGGEHHFVELAARPLRRVKSRRQADTHI